MTAPGWVSLAAVAWALDDAPDVPPSMVSTLVAIARYADQDGCGAHPSLAALAWHTRKSARQVRSDLRMLQKLGLITPGDPAAAEHLRGDRRPPVYDLPMHRRRHRRDPGEAGRQEGPISYPQGGSPLPPVEATGGSPLPPVEAAGGSTASDGGKWASAEEARRSQKQASVPPTVQIILAATDATPDEAAAVADLIHREKTPRSLPGLLRRLAADGDLAPWLDQVRAAARRAGITAWLATLTGMPPCPHAVPGGDQLRPDTGQPQCPLCRAASQ